MIFASTERRLQKLMGKLKETVKKFSVKINDHKTKTTVVCRDGEGAINITIDGQRIEQVKRFKHV